MLLEPIVSRLVAAEVASMGAIGYPDELASICTARFRAGFNDNPLVYNVLCTRYNRWVVSRYWGWLHLPPLYERVKPFVHVWVDFKDRFARDPLIGFKGSVWYCLLRRLHRLKYEYIETGVALERGELMAPDGIRGRTSEGRLFDLSFVYRVCPWQAARIAADLVALNWGSALLFTTRHRWGSTEDRVAKTLLESIKRACVIPLEPPDPTWGLVLEARLQGYINELVSSVLNPLNTYRLRREHLVTVYYMARVFSDGFADPFERLLADLWMLSRGRIEYRKFAPVYLF